MRAMATSADSPTRDPVSEALYLPGPGGPLGELSADAGLSARDTEQIASLMNALAHLREAEQALSDASRRYMRLNAQDMRALHYLIVAKRQDRITTPGMLAAHLRVSAASMTKLLNRLERDGHIVRRLHPTDRRAFSIEITPATEASATQTVGRQHARRLYAAARLTGDEREVVIRFLEDMAQELSLSHADWADVPTTADSDSRPPSRHPHL